MIRVCETGRSAVMRHLGRTHYVQVGWLKERFQSPELKLIFEPSAKQAADIYTKGFDNAQKWEVASRNIAIVDKKDFDVITLNQYLNGDDYYDETVGEAADGSHALPARLHPRWEDQHSLQKSPNLKKTKRMLTKLQNEYTRSWKSSWD